MFWKIFVALGFVAGGVASAQTPKTATCHYQFESQTIATVVYQWDVSGNPLATVQYNEMGAPAQTVSFTPDVLTEDELLHGWIQKEESDGGIEAVIYKTKQSDGQSRITNPNSPIQKDLWGDCDFSLTRRL